MKDYMNRIHEDAKALESDTVNDFIQDIKEIIRYANAAYGEWAKRKADKSSKYANTFDLSYDILYSYNLSNLDRYRYLVKVKTNRADFTILKTSIERAAKSKKLRKERRIIDNENNSFYILSDLTSLKDLLNTHSAQDLNTLLLDFNGKYEFTEDGRLDITIAKSGTGFKVSINVNESEGINFTSAHFASNIQELYSYIQSGLTKDIDLYR